MKRKLFAWIVLVSFVLSIVGAQPASAQDDEIKPPYRHSEAPPAPPSHPPVGTSRNVDGSISGIPPAMPQGDLSAQSVSVGEPGLSFRYLQEFGVNSVGYIVDTEPPFHLNRPSGLFLDGADNLFITEERGHRVLKFTSAGVNTTPTLGHVSIPWGHDDYLSSPRDGAVDASGNIWVLTNSSVKKFDATTGALLGSIPATDPWQTGSDPSHFGGDLWGMAFGPGETGNDYLYVADTTNNRIQIFDTTSTADPIVPLAIIGTGDPETDSSGFSYPTRIAFDSSGTLYVVDSDNTRIQSCTSTDPSNPDTNPWTCDTFFGETGVYDSDLTHLNWPTGIAIDSSDNIFIADTNNYRVLKCDLTPTCVVFAGITLEDGSDDARFAFPSDIALDSSDNVYVSDSDNFRVQKFDSTGALIGTLGETGVPYLTDAAHIYDPQGVAVAPDGSIYVTEGYGNRLLKFNAAGVQQWTVNDEPGVGGTDIFHLGNTWGGGPSGNPAIDASGRIYVADSDNNRVQIFNPDGTYYATLGGSWGFGTYKFRCMGGVAIAPVSQDILVVDRCNNRVQVFTSARVYKGTLGVTNEPGDDDSHFNRPWGVAVDSAGNIYVGDSDNYRVQKCTLSGGCTTFVGVTGEQGNDFEHFQHPEQIAVDSLDRVYVADPWNNCRVQVFDSTGAYLTTIGGAWGAEAGNMTSPRGLAVDSGGNVYVTDSDTHRVQKFANGTPNWQQVNVNGFGDLANGRIFSMTVFDGKVYAGTSNISTGGQIWKSTDGTTWAAAVSDGFGDSTNVGINHMLAFGGNLYAGTQNYYDDDPDPGVDDWQTNGAQLWRFDGTDWTNVTPDTFDGTTNSEFFQLAEFNGYLYVSTWAFSSHGGEIWRCDGTTACGESDWTQVVSDGFGIGSNAGISSFASFGGYLYAGTWHDGGESDKGGQVWRSNDGEAWSQINADGFGDGGNIAISSMAAFGGYLYAATDDRDSGSGAEVWRCQTCSGTDWSQVVDNGLGSSSSQYRPNLVQLGGTLYLVLGNQDTGLNVWRTSNGTTWVQSAADGFGNRNTVSPYFGNSSAVFGTNLYVGTLNWNNGAQIWRTSSDQQIDTVTVQSNAAQDGWILESSETSNAGGKMDVSAQNINLGDDASKKQYRGMLSFSTGAALPDTAVITKVTLKIKKQAIKGGGNPVTTFQGIYADIKKGTFGTSALALTDFNLAGSKTKGPFKPNPVSNWYSMDLTSGNAYINKLASSSGLTQIRLRFKLDDNNNAVANYLSFYSGNAPAASRPQLIVEYYVP